MNITLNSVKKIAREAMPYLIGLLIVLVIAFFFFKTEKSLEGTIKVVAAPGTTVYPDLTRGNITKKVPRSGELVLRYEAGEHGIITKKDDVSYPWGKTVLVEPGKETTLQAFSLPMEPNLETIPADSVSFNTINETFEPHPVYTQENPLASTDGKSVLYMKNDVIIVEWLGDLEEIPEYICGGLVAEECRLIPVLNFEIVRAAAQSGTEAAGRIIDTEISGLSFLGENDQLVAFSNSNGVYVMEIDRRDTQNFQPLYTGDLNPRFMVRENEVLIKSDSGFSIIPLAI